MGKAERTAGMTITLLWDATLGIPSQVFYDLIAAAEREGLHERYGFLLATHPAIEDHAMGDAISWARVPVRVEAPTPEAPQQPHNAILGALPLEAGPEAAYPELES